MPEAFDSGKLAELLQKSYRAESNARKALCLAIKVNPDDLSFLTDRSERDFALELVEYLCQLGKFQALLRLCDEIIPAFRESIYADELARLRAEIEKKCVPLSGRVQDPMTRDTMIELRAELRATREQLRVVIDYKERHDLMHRFQYECYNPIVGAASDFSRDKEAQETIRRCKEKLENLSEDLKKILGRIQPMNAEKQWLQKLCSAHGLLDKAMRERNIDDLEESIVIMRSILTTYPVWINTYMVAAVSCLRLHELVRRIEPIINDLDAIPIHREFSGSFRNAVNDMNIENDKLSILINEHDSLQSIDEILYKIEDNISEVMAQMADHKSNLKLRINELHMNDTASWEQIKKQEKNIDDFLSKKDSSNAEDSFREYRTSMGLHFYIIDTRLRTTCANMRDAGEELYNLMNSMITNVVTRP